MRSWRSSRTTASWRCRAVPIRGDSGASGRPRFARDSRAALPAFRTSTTGTTAIGCAERRASPSGRSRARPRPATTWKSAAAITSSFGTAKSSRRTRTGRSWSPGNPGDRPNGPSGASQQVTPPRWPPAGAGASESGPNPGGRSPAIGAAIFGCSIGDLDQPAFTRRPDHRLRQLNVPQSVEPGRIRLAVVADRVVERGDGPHHRIPAGMRGDLLARLGDDPELPIPKRPRAVDADDAAFGPVEVDVGLVMGDLLVRVDVRHRPVLEPQQ